MVGYPLVSARVHSYVRGKHYANYITGHSLIKWSLYQNIGLDL